MNTFKKYCPNVFVAQCTEQHEKGEIIVLTTKYGKEIKNEVHNYLGKTKEGFHLYSITRLDGFNSQERATKKAEKLKGYAANAEKRSYDFYKKSDMSEKATGIPFGQPILVGHHSERRHRKTIERAWNNLGKSVAESEKAKEYQRRAEYWAERANKINLSMPDSLEYYEEELRKAKEYHQLLKDNPEKRSHSYSLQYANKAVKDLEKKVYTAVKLWGDDEDLAQLDKEKQEKAQKQAKKKKGMQQLISETSTFFAFNTDQLKKGIEKAKKDGHLQEGERVVHFGRGMYVPPMHKEKMLNYFK